MAAKILSDIFKIVVPFVVIAFGAYHFQEKENEIPSILIFGIGCLLLFLLHVPIKEKKTDNNYKPE